MIGYYTECHSGAKTPVLAESDEIPEHDGMSAIESIATI